jgi:hypothetical protein
MILLPLNKGVKLLDPLLSSRAELDSKSNMLIKKALYFGVVLFIDSK